MLRSLALLAVLAGCNETNPYVREGEWRPLNANTANLRAMVADPADLYGGRPAVTSQGVLAADAVARLREGRVRRLPATGVTEVKVSDPNAAAAAGGAAPGGTP